MKLKTKYRIFIEFSLIIVGIIAFVTSFSFYVPYLTLFGQLCIYFGITSIVLDFLIRTIQTDKNIETLGIILILFSIANFLRHWIFYFILFNEIELLLESFWYLGIEIIWMITSIFLVILSIKLIRNKLKIPYSEYIKTKEFKFILVFTTIAIILELPVFDIHPSLYGGLHGHGFWDAGSHMH